VKERDKLRRVPGVLLNMLMQTPRAIGARRRGEREAVASTMWSADAADSTRDGIDAAAQGWFRVQVVTGDAGK